MGYARCGVRLREAGRLIGGIVSEPSGRSGDVASRHVMQPQSAIHDVLSAWYSPWSWRSRFKLSTRKRSSSRGLTGADVNPVSAVEAAIPLIRSSVGSYSPCGFLGIRSCRSPCPPLRMNRASSRVDAGSTRASRGVYGVAGRLPHVLQSGVSSGARVGRSSFSVVRIGRKAC